MNFTERFLATLHKLLVSKYQLGNLCVSLTDKFQCILVYTSVTQVISFLNLQ